MNVHSTREAAKKLGLSFTSLNRYIAAKKIPFPPLSRVGGVRVRLWSDKDIAKVRAVLPTLKNGRKLRYKKQSKRK
jgi:predicted DNA-binding transcriptional regulator AlpA